MRSWVKCLFLGILAITVLTGGCNYSLKSLETSTEEPLSFSDIVAPTPVPDSPRQVFIGTQTISIALSPTRNRTTATGIGSASASGNIGTNWALSLPASITQVATASVGYSVITGNIKVSFGDIATRNIESYTISIRLASGSGLLTQESRSVVPVYVSIDGSSQFHRIKTTPELLKQVVASEFQTPSQHFFTFRFDCSAVEDSTFTGELVLDLSATLASDRQLDAEHQAHLLGRGINLGNCLEEIPEGNNPTGFVVAASDFQTIKAAGFDTVRIPINWAGRTGNAPDYLIPTSFFERVDTVIDQALGMGLNVVIDCHGFSTELSQNPSGQSPKLTAIWRQIAQRYKNKSSRVYYELFNEPTNEIDSATWNTIQNNLIATVRAIDPFHTIIITGVNWSNADSLPGIQLNVTDNLIASVHYYDPILLTHQGAEWLGVDFSATGLIWPGPPLTPVSVPASAQNWVKDWLNAYNQQASATNPASQKQIDTTFDAIQSWKIAHIPVLISEFGTYQRSDLNSRVNWTNAVRSAAEQREMPWCYWEYASGFGIYNRSSGSWNTRLFNALMNR